MISSVGLPAAVGYFSASTKSGDVFVVGLKSGKRGESIGPSRGLVLVSCCRQSLADHVKQVSGRLGGQLRGQRLDRLRERLKSIWIGGPFDGLQDRRQRRLRLLGGSFPASAWTACASV